MDETSQVQGLNEQVMENIVLEIDEHIKNEEKKLQELEKHPEVGEKHQADQRISTETVENESVCPDLDQISDESQIQNGNSTVEVDVTAVKNTENEGSKSNVEISDKKSSVAEILASEWDDGNVGSPESKHEGQDDSEDIEETIGENKELILTEMDDVVNSSTIDSRKEVEQVNVEETIIFQELDVVDGEIIPYENPPVAKEISVIEMNVIDESKDRQKPQSTVELDIAETTEKVEKSSVTPIQLITDELNEITKVKTIKPPPIRSMFVKPDIIKNTIAQGIQELMEKAIPPTGDLIAKLPSDKIGRINTDDQSKNGNHVSDEELIAILEGTTDVDKSLKEKGKLTVEQQREIALRQLKQIEGDTPGKTRRGKVPVVDTNVPNTKIISAENNFNVDDPFQFDDATHDKLPVAKVPVSNQKRKTYGRKTDEEKPIPKEIFVPKEIIEIEKAEREALKLERAKKLEADKLAKKLDKADKKKEDEKKKPSSQTAAETDTDKNVVLISTRSRPIKRKVIWDPSSNESITTASSVLKEKIEGKKSPIKKKSPEKNPCKEIKETKESKQPPQNNSPQTKAKVVGSPGKKRGRLSEIDRLLMDEGAINMLCTIDNPTSENKNKNIMSMDMRKKKRMIMTALSTSNTSGDSSGKTLRKKESKEELPSPTASGKRKLSTDTIAQSISSFQSPPSSPKMYPPMSEGSRIIRRHSSSSSFSSGCMSPRRLSGVESEIKAVAGALKIHGNTVEGSAAERQSDVEQTSPSTGNRSSKRRSGGVPIFVKRYSENSYTGLKNADGETKDKAPEKVNKRKSGDDVGDLKKTKLTKNEGENKDINSASKKSTKSGDSVEEETQNSTEKRASTRSNAGTYNSSYKEICIKKYTNLVQIILAPQSTKIKNAFNIQVMRELCDALNNLKKDPACNAVLLTSTGSTFSCGLDYTYLIQSNMEKRKMHATELANAVRELTLTLAMFPRTIIVGVQGAACGLGVSILPLCDLVFVSDKATFRVINSKLGCLPEGGATISLPHVTSHALASELLMASHTLTATEALRHGLASRVLWPEGYMQELIPTCKMIAGQSAQAMIATKAVVRRPLVEKIQNGMDAETKMLIQHWCSNECQQSFKTYVDQEDMQ